MKKKTTKLLNLLGVADTLDFYVLFAAVLTFAYVSLCSYGRHLYQFFLPLPCILLYGALLERKAVWKCRKKLVLPLLMVLWFIFLRLVHGGESARIYPLGLFAVIYLFAFPLASLLEDGEKKKALMYFAGAYLAGAAMLTAAALMLLLDCVPAFLGDAIFWYGSRLYVFWSPNMVACIWMIAVVLCTTFMWQTKSRKLRVGLGILLVLMLVVMVLTNCRTAMLLTGGYLGASVFFAVAKDGKIKILLSVVVALLILLVFFAVGSRIHQANHDYLEAKTAEQTSDAVSEADNTAAIAPPAEATKVTITNGQGSLVKDLGTLNSRTRIWSAAFDAIRDNPMILVWGVHCPGEYIRENNYFAAAHLHNSWIECLMGMGIPGLVMAIVFTLSTAWNCLIILVKDHQNVWKRNVALLALLLMAAAFLEPYLFYTIVDYHPYNLMFFLCAGYLSHWKEVNYSRAPATVRKDLCGRQ